MGPARSAAGDRFRASAERRAAAPLAGERCPKSWCPESAASGALRPDRTIRSRLIRDADCVRARAQDLEILDILDWPEVVSSGDDRRCLVPSCEITGAPATLADKAAIARVTENRSVEGKDIASEGRRQPRHLHPSERLQAASSLPRERSSSALHRMRPRPPRCQHHRIHRGSRKHCCHRSCRSNFRHPPESMGGEICVDGARTRQMAPSSTPSCHK